MEDLAKLIPLAGGLLAFSGGLLAFLNGCFSDAKTATGPAKVLVYFYPSVILAATVLVNAGASVAWTYGHFLAGGILFAISNIAMIVFFLRGKDATSRVQIVYLSSAIALLVSTALLSIIFDVTTRLVDLQRRQTQTVNILIRTQQDLINNQQGLLNTQQSIIEKLAPK
jgi:hypothetical protein